MRNYVEAVMELASRFPFPFAADNYQYSNNLRPLDPPITIRITDEYTEEMVYKRDLLKQYPERCYQSENHTLLAQWEVLNHLLHELAEEYPASFRLHKQDDTWTFENRLLHETKTFRYLDVNSLGMEPLDFVGRHVQEDLLLLTQSDEKLILEAGQLCFPGNWSLKFDVGMPFLHIHSPVPNLVSGGLANKIERFLTMVETGKPWTRLNWSMNAGQRLDTSPETFDEWGSRRFEVTEDNVGSLVHLRVEDQNILRMPRSNTLLFTIHTYLSPIAEVIQNHQWLKRLYLVMNSLAPDLIEYKGLSAFHSTLVNYLEGQLVLDT